MLRPARDPTPTRRDVATDGPSPAGRFEWERAVRALEIRPPLRKLVALMLATYADRDGRNAHPGEQRLADECGITTRAVREHLSALGAGTPATPGIGLLHRTFHGSKAGRRKLADEYFLTLPADMKSRADAANKAHEASREKGKHRNAGSGDGHRITGTPVPDHRNVSAHHRNERAESTGTPVPPTTTGTKDVDHSSPTPHPIPASTTDRTSSAGAMDAHEYEDDQTAHHDCAVCTMPRRHPGHAIGRRSA